MSGSGFVKLYSTILTSSIWLESDATLRVWIAMLSTADENGYVGASVGGLAHVSRVAREDCVRALEILSSPDSDSRTEDNDGRRIAKADGGWVVLNHQKYRDMRTQKQVTDAERQRRHREGVTGRDGHDSHSDVATDGEGDVEGEERVQRTTTSSSPAREVVTVTLEGIARIFPNPTRALPLLAGMTNGLGTPRGQSVSVETLAEAAAELEASGGDVTPHRFKAFVRKVLERGNPPRGQPSNERPRSGDKASRGVQALGTWLANSEIPDAEVVDDGEQ